MTKLRKVGADYYTTNKVNFSGIKIDQKSIKTSLEFSLQMSFGDGFHRQKRSGGSSTRNQIEIFSNTFQGKLAEFCVVDFFKKNNLNSISNPDITISGKGVWDSIDVLYNSKKINIKSCAFFSNLVLLEAKDWSSEGEYLPNLKTDFAKYDYFILVRIKDDIKASFRKKTPTKNKADLVNEIINKVEKTHFYYDIPGYFTTKTLKHIIDKKYVLPKNALLNGKTKVDADNYYIQSGDLRNTSLLINELK